MTTEDLTPATPAPPAAPAPLTPLSPALHAELSQFYARQMHWMDGDEFAAFAATFVPDGIFRTAVGGELRGPEAIEAASRASARRYGDGQGRHWFAMMSAEEHPDGSVSTRYYATVTVTSPDGSVLVEPTCFVEDELVRIDGQLRSASRTITRDDLAARARASA